MRKLLLQALFGVLAMPAWAQRNLAPLPRIKNGIVVIAHRGDHVGVPENTLASIERAIRAGVDYVEIDLRTTSDGFLVLSHDGSVNRMTDGTGNIKDLSLAEIKKLHVVPTDTADKTPYTIAEFSEVLRICRHKMNIYLDFKEADVPQTWREIQAAGMEKNVVVYLNKPEQYQQWRNAAPHLPLMASIPSEWKAADQFTAFFESKPVEVVDNVADPEMLAVVRKKGVAVWLDVESRTEDAKTWAEAIARGVQGLQTDHPDALLEYLYANKLRKRAKASH